MAKDTKVYSHHVRAIYKVPGGAAARAGGTMGIAMDGGSSPAAPRPTQCGLMGPAGWWGALVLWAQDGGMDGWMDEYG